jgi:hypothetical protein
MRRFASGMIPEFHAMLEGYRSLEFRVCELMQKICIPFCSACPTPCCKVCFCREAEESPFLVAVHEARHAFDENLGYLGSRGCRLGVGRPPVCHAFVCSGILNSQPTDAHRYALDCLGELVSFVGKNVWRGRHLVEAPTEDDLRGANAAKFRDRLEIAESALIALKAFFTEDRNLQPEELRVLALVKKVRGAGSGIP